MILGIVEGLKAHFHRKDNHAPYEKEAMGGETIKGKKKMTVYEINTNIIILLHSYYNIKHMQLCLYRLDY